MFVKLSLRDQLVCFAEYVGKILHAVVFLLPLHNFFLRVCLPTTFTAVLIFFLPLMTCEISRAAILKKSTPTIFARAIFFTPKWICGSLKKLFKFSESRSTLSTNTLTELNLYWSWSNLCVASFSLEMNFGRSPNYENKRKDTDRYKRCFFTAHVSEDSVKTLERDFEQWSVLQVALTLIALVLSICYNVPVFELRNEVKATQQSHR